MPASSNIFQIVPRSPPTALLSPSSGCFRCTFGVHIPESRPSSRFRATPIGDSAMVARLGPRVAASVHHRMSGRLATHADDVGQDAMIRVLRGLPGSRAETEAQLFRWTHQVVANAVAQWTRTNLPMIVATCALETGIAAEPPPSDDPAEPVWEVVLQLLERAYVALRPESRAAY
jgi:DNA-directed RNA polymerase specialized sigma24 family protein